MMLQYDGSAHIVYTAIYPRYTNLYTERKFQRIKIQLELFFGLCHVDTEGMDTYKKGKSLRISVFLFSSFFQESRDIVSRVQFV